MKKFAIPEGAPQELNHYRFAEARLLMDGEEFQFTLIAYDINPWDDYGAAWLITLCQEIATKDRTHPFEDPAIWAGTGRTQICISDVQCFVDTEGAITMLLPLLRVAFLTERLDRFRTGSKPGGHDPELDIEILFDRIEGTKAYFKGPLIDHPAFKSSEIDLTFEFINRS